MYKPEGEFGKNPITWNAELSLLANSVIIKQLLMVLVVSSLFVFFFLIILEAFEGTLTINSALRYLLISVGIMGVLSLLAILIMLVYYGNRYEYKFVVDDVGVKSETVGGTRKKNNIINLLSLFTGKPGPAGAGMIAASRQSEFVSWKKVDNIDVNPEKLEVVLRRKGRAIMLLKCMPGNFQKIVNRANDALSGKVHKI